MLKQNIIANFLIRNDYGVNLPSIIDRYTDPRLPDTPKARHTNYMRFSRLLDRWEDIGYITTKKIDGLTWAYPEKPILNLISAPSKKHPTVDLIKAYSDCATFHTGILSLLSRLENRRHFEYRNSVFLLKYDHLTPHGWKRLNENFDAYKDDTQDKYIIMENTKTGKFQAIPYTHRFKKDRITETIDKYNHIWHQADKHTVGIHLTLTFAPGTPMAILNKQIGPGFRQFMAWATKKVGRRPRYLKILEFQDNGRPHLHIILFGIGRLADKKTEITPEVLRCGFGPINYIYQIHKISNGNWAWSGNRPTDATTQSIRSHFKKYLEKALTLNPNDPQHYKIPMYWLTNKQFFTFSKALGPSPNKDVFDIENENSDWTYIGVFYKYEIPGIFNVQPNDHG